MALRRTPSAAVRVCVLDLVDYIDNVVCSKMAWEEKLKVTRNEVNFESKHTSSWSPIGWRILLGYGLAANLQATNTQFLNSTL